MNIYLKNIYALKQQLEEKALSSAYLEKLKSSKKPDGVVIVGMGGSGLAGDAIKALRAQIGIPVPVEVIKSPKTPKLLFKNPIYVFVSFSGNTAETISALKGVLPRNLKVAVITTGGKLKSLARAKKLPLVSFDASDLTPRQSVGYTYKALKKVLLTQFSSIRKFPTPSISFSRLESSGKQLAKKLKNRSVLIYSREEDSHLTTPWKAALNETGKIPAFGNVFPEVAHNELVSFESRLSKSFFILFIVPPSFKADPISHKLRTFLNIAKSKGIGSLIITPQGKNPEEVVWNNFVLAHFTSYHLAKISGKNPIETKLIDRFKKLTNK